MRDSQYYTKRIKELDARYYSLREEILPLIEEPYSYSTQKRINSLFGEQTKILKKLSELSDLQIDALAQETRQRLNLNR